MIMPRFSHAVTTGKLIIVSLLAALLVFAPTDASADGKRKKKENIYSDLNLFSEVLQRVESDYVDEVEMRELIVGGIRGMLKTLDPHTQFLDTKQYRDLMVGTKGSFGGLGIVISIRDNILTVVSPIEGTPASRLGIQGGDQILYIEDEPTKGFTSEDAVKRLRGPEGTKVTIKIRREGVEGLLEYTITRAIIKLKSVPYKFIRDGIGYVRLSQFSKRTSEELASAIDSLETVGINGLLVDLRGNPGGLLDQAVAVSDLFLDEGELIVFTKGRKRNTNKRFVDERPSPLKGYPLVVLVDGGSASASEIVSGAVQDWDRGLVVGKQSFGKGSVQSVLPLSQDCGLKLTTAKYYTPSGRCIHRDDRDSHTAIKTAEAVADDSAGADREVFHTNAGRPVFGGGGITPDIEIDQRVISKVEETAERKSLYFKFAVDYAAYHEVTPGWDVTDDVYADFLKLVHEEARDVDDEQIAEAEYYLRNGIKREIYRKAFGDQAAYIVMTDVDDQLKAAFDIFKEYKAESDLMAVSERHRAEREALAAAAEKDSAGAGLAVDALSGGEAR